MEEKLGYSPKVMCPVDTDDVKYVSGLSTMLVATIQEAKDRISQIEYIFCSQLYPGFQSRSKSLQTIYSEARKEAEDAWRENKEDLFLQLQKLQLEKQEALQHNQSLKLEMEKSLREVKENSNSLLAKVTAQQVRINKLEQELKHKSREVDEGMELQRKLLQLTQSKALIIVDMEKKLKNYEERTSELTAKLKNVNKKVKEVRERTEEAVEKKQLVENSVKNIKCLMPEFSDSGLPLIEYEKEKAKVYKLEYVEENTRELEKEHSEKNKEIEEGRGLQIQLFQQIDSKDAEIMKQKQHLEESEKDKKLLLRKINGLQEKTNDQQVSLLCGNKAAKEKASYEMLPLQIEMKDSELLAEKKRRRDATDAYKRLKSQYKFLCKMSGLTAENMVQQNKLEDESGPSKHQQNPKTSPAACETTKVKVECEINDDFRDDKMIKPIPISSFQSPNPSFIAPKCLSIIKSDPIIGKKRSVSHWIGTRSNQFKGGLDPHDDFLDTPLEHIRGNLKKALKEVIDFDIPVQKDMNPNSSDDETQEMNVGPSLVKQLRPVPTDGDRNFKYVDPLRKKADRENLKGVQCKQCKKFYDAVLPNNGGKDSDGGKRSFQCEHLDGVSRHRCKYVPPMTPEGFWNIGFESEM